ncbi:uncharacterized protein LOC129768960 [Toxorhynchites rutilus septentrionalis]|uniref:uncharacterized protein LOC129768960 n=1 Tax=Toxorhynchites rutilus septentrionalis TaxID=329112 RepID=UPI00247875A6|nr:uncharacterized protein LOC129768960 [Toxorhynchites rutilus septentrionalis]
MAFNCSLCGLSPRATIIVVGTISLLFSGVYIFFTTAGILVQNCQIDMTTTPGKSTIYLYYLRSSQCERVSLYDLGFEQVPPELHIYIPDVSAAAKRTYIFCMVGVVLYGLWFVSSIFMIGSTCTPCMGRFCIAFGLYPYIVILFAVLIFDAVVFVFYFIDFINSFNLDSVIKLLEIEYQGHIQDLFIQIEYVQLVVPPLLMWFAASKGVIGWIIFLLLGFVMIGVAGRLWIENKPVPSYNTAMQTTSSISVAPGPTEFTEGQKTTNVEFSSADARYKDPARQPNDNLTYADIAPVIVDVRRTVEPLKGGQDSSQREYSIQSSHSEGAPNPLKPNSTVNPYIDKRFSYIPGNPQPFSYLAGPPQLNSRNSSSVPEVRNQLPWTYFPSSEDLAATRKAAATVKDQKENSDDDLSSGISKQVSYDDRSSDEGKWSGPEYRY